MTSPREMPQEEKSRIQKLMQESHIPGMSIALVSEGKIQTAALGVTEAESKKNVTEDSVFWACSLSKPVFAYLVLKLIQENKLEKDFFDTKLWDEKFGPRGDRDWLTPRMILSHQTGLPNEGPPDFKFKPGEGFRYSGEGYAYLQRVIEEKTKRPLQELAKEYLFDPLGMTHSSFSLPDADSIVEGHDEMQHPKHRLFKIPANNNNAAGSLHTTASDYARFLVHCMNDAEFKALTTPQKISMERDVDAAGKVDKQTLQGIDWGLGWGIQQSSDDPIAFHWGHGPGAKAFVAVNMESKSAVVYFANSENGLAITQELVTPVGNIQTAMTFLSKKYGYEHYHDPAFQQKHLVMTPETKEEHDLNVKRQTWLDELTQAKNKPVEVKKEILQQYIGEYPPNNITLKENKLELELFGQKHELIPINATTFVSTTDLTFRIEFDPKNKQATTHFLYPHPRFGPTYHHNKANSIFDSMLENTLAKFHVKPDEFKMCIEYHNYDLLRSENPIAAHEKRFMDEHKDDFDALTALAIERRKYLTAILSSEKKLEGTKVIPFMDLMKMPHPHHISALLTEHGLTALKEGLLSPKDALQFGENSSEYLRALCSDEGLLQLKNAQKAGNLATMMNSIINHANEHNNVGALEHSLKKGIPLDKVQADIDGEAKRFKI